MGGAPRDANVKACDARMCRHVLGVETPPRCRVKIVCVWRSRVFRDPTREIERESGWHWQGGRPAHCFR